VDYVRKKLAKCYIWSIALYSAETWIFKKIEQTQLGCYKVWCWKRMKISWANQVENEEALHRVREKRNIIQSYRQLIKGRLTKLVTSCIGSTLLKHTEGKHIDGKIEGIGSQERRHKQLLDDLKETRQY
jgi:hypothetical protein